MNTLFKRATIKWSCCTRQTILWQSGVVVHAKKFWYNNCNVGSKTMHKRYINHASTMHARHEFSVYTPKYSDMINGTWDNDALKTVKNTPVWIVLLSNEACKFLFEFWYAQPSLKQTFQLVHTRWPKWPQLTFNQCSHSLDSRLLIGASNPQWLVHPRPIPKFETSDWCIQSPISRLLIGISTSNPQITGFWLAISPNICGFWLAISPNILNYLGI